MGEEPFRVFMVLCARTRPAVFFFPAQIEIIIRYYRR